MTRWTALLVCRHWGTLDLAAALPRRAEADKRWTTGPVPLSRAEGGPTLRRQSADLADLVVGFAYGD